MQSFNWLAALGYELSSGEQVINCPFPEHEDTRASFSINTDIGVGNCHACGKMGSHIILMQEYFKISDYRFACAMEDCFRQAISMAEYKRSFMLSNQTIRYFRDDNVSSQVLREHGIRSTQSGDVIIPYVMYGKVMFHRIYRPGKMPKMLTPRGHRTGHLWNYDRIMNAQAGEQLLLCAGERDAIQATARGFLATTTDCGEGSAPSLLLPFVGRKVAIIYDNDEAGTNGAVRCAKALLPVASEVKIIDLSGVCTEQHEDLRDFFVKYARPASELRRMIDEAPAITGGEAFMTRVSETRTYRSAMKKGISLMQATEAQNLDELLSSHVNVIAVTDQVYSCPSVVHITAAGMSYEWQLDAVNRPQAILELVGSVASNKMQQTLCKYAGMPMDAASDAKVHVISTRSIYRVVLGDDGRRLDDSKRQTFDAWVFDTPMQPGRTYRIGYKIVAHPAKGRQLEMIVLEAKETSDLDQFKVGNKLKRALDKFRQADLDKQAAFVRGHIGYESDEDLIKLVLITMHAPARLKIKHESIKGMLDVLCVSNARQGKSSTTEAIMDLTGQGAIMSLASGASTIQGLTGGSGGSSKDGYYTRMGFIPQNHRKFVALEEMGKCTANIMGALTDIRSSGRVRISRVAGSVEFPAEVRMLWLSNPKASTDDNTSVSVQSFPHGAELMQPLVPNQEDLARFDVIYIMPPKEVVFNFASWEPEPGWDFIEKEDYEQRLLWAWTRTESQILFSDEVLVELQEASQALYDKFKCSVPIFTTETHKKLARLSAGIAALSGSADETCNFMIVTEDHVRQAERLLDSVYSSPQWKLDRLADMERTNVYVDDNSLEAVRQLYARYPVLMQQLTMQSVMDKTHMELVVGQDSQAVNSISQRLLEHNLIKIRGRSIRPEPKLRTCMSRVAPGADGEELTSIMLAERTENEQEGQEEAVRASGG